MTKLKRTLREAVDSSNDEQSILGRGRRATVRRDLADAIRQSTGLPQVDAALVLDQCLAEIADALARGEDVKFQGFGRFEVRQKGARIGRNPKTGVEAIISPRRSIAFKASGILKGRCSGEGAL